MMNDKRSVEENRRMMQMVGNLEADLRGGAAVNVKILEDLEIAVYGSFAKMLETRLRHLKAGLAEWRLPGPTDFEKQLMKNGPG